MSVELSLFSDRLAFKVPLRALATAFILSVVVLCILLWSLMNGSYELSRADVISTLRGNAPTDAANMVVWEFRFPRTLVAMFTGAFLAVSGAILQYVTRNPLADPSLIGISQGASFAVVWMTIMMPMVSVLYQPIAALGGAILVSSLILFFSASQRGDTTLRFILMGIGVAATITAITTALLTYGDIAQSLDALGWLAGSIHSAGWDEVLWLGITSVLAIPLLLAAVRPISAIRFGENVATGLGINVRLSRWGLIGLAVALAATAVAAVGPLGFVGLVAPHLARRLSHAGPGLHILITGLTGSILVGSADFLGRVAFAPIQIPAGIITAVLGVPVFVFLILRTQARSQL